VSNDQARPGRREGYALSVDRTIEAAPEAIFDAFVALYDSDRPSWVTDSELDLRPGGRWSVGFAVPNEATFREERVITAVERPRRLAYDMSATFEDQPGFDTAVEVTIEPAAGGQRVRLEQHGFPTTETRDVFAGAWPDVLGEVDRRVTARRG
jgi:uncharacterized protein YndB with AHSA1/START domain